LIELLRTRRIHHRRTGRPVRRGPLHRLPRTCPQQAGSARGQVIDQCVGAPCGAAPRHAPFGVGRDDSHVPAAARRAQRLPLREPEPSARAITPPEPTPIRDEENRSPEGNQGDSRPILPCRKWFGLRDEADRQQLSDGRLRLECSTRDDTAPAYRRVVLQILHDEVTRGGGNAPGDSARHR
jgi:hypothetical protein